MQSYLKQISLFGIIAITVVMVFSLASCQNDPDPGKDPEIISDLQGTTWADANGNELAFTKTGVTVKTASGQSQSYTIMDSVTNGSETTLYFNEDKSANYIKYNIATNVIVEVNISNINNTDGWEKDTDVNPSSEYWPITWNLNGGEKGAGTQHPTQIAKGAVLAKPSPDPTKADSAFGGWYTDSGLTQAYNFTDAVTANLTLYAKWEAQQPASEYWSITWNFNGGAAGTGAQHPTQIAKGAVLAKPSPDPTKADSAFDGWYADFGLTQTYNFASAVIADLNLYAKWETGNPPPPLASYEMVYVLGGTFTMGSSDSQDWSAPHEVTLSGFYLGKTEVTQKQWHTVMGTTIQELQTGAAPTDNTDYGRGDNYPVYYVSWYDALVFCNKLSMAEGLSPAYSIGGSTDPAAWGTVPRNSNATWNGVVMVTDSTGYRLPTEAQWEYAAKGGPSASDPYKIYSGSDTVDDVAWYDGNNGSSGEHGYGTKQVGTKAANELGIHDMSGNMFEWCWDWYKEFSDEAQTDPEGASSGPDRVFRGGDWFSPAEHVRSVRRFRDNPSRRDDALGFRLLRPAQ